MSSTSSVCQGLQSCLEPRIVEPLVLRLKLAPPKSNFSQSSALTNRPNTENRNNENTKSSSDDAENKTNNNCDLGAWSFIQALANSPQTPQKSPENNDAAADKEKVYVHPLAKLSASMLSDRSLEMCTESLGSETGSDISESMEDYFSDNADFSPKAHSSTNRGAFSAATKKTCRRSFPPPLTSISGSGGCVRVKPHREDGRLVIKAVAVSSSKTFFHAERGNGRLRLHLLKENSGDSDIKVADEEREEAIEEEEEEEDDDDNHVADDVEELQIDNDDDVEELEDDGDVEAEYETEEEEGDDSVCWGEEMDGDIENVGGEMGIQKFQKLSRCKEGGHRNKGLWNLEAYLVATS